MIGLALIAAAASSSVVVYHCDPQAALGRAPGVTDPAKFPSENLGYEDMRQAKFDLRLDLSTRAAEILAPKADVLKIGGKRMVTEYKPIPMRAGGDLITFALLGDPYQTLNCGPDEGNACRATVRISAIDFEGPIDFNIDPPAKAVTTKGIDRLARIVGTCVRKH